MAFGESPAGPAPRGDGAREEEKGISEGLSRRDKRGDRTLMLHPQAHR